MGQSRFVVTLHLYWKEKLKMRTRAKTIPWGQRDRDRILLRHRYWEGYKTFSAALEASQEHSGLHNPDMEIIWNKQKCSGIELVIQPNWTFRGEVTKNLTHVCRWEKLAEGQPWLQHSTNLALCLSGQMETWNLRKLSGYEKNNFWNWVLCLEETRFCSSSM